MEELRPLPEPTFYHCPKCGAPHHYQLHRGWFVKNFLFFLPLRKFFCAKCSKAFYVFNGKKENVAQ